jgi:hypothetical protein
VNENTISNIEHNTTGNFYGINNLSGKGGNNNISINFNTIQNIGKSSTGGFYGIFTGSAVWLYVNNNIIRQFSRQGNGIMYGIQLSSPDNIEVNENQIYTFSSSSTTNTSAMWGVYSLASAVNVQLIDNKIYDFSSASTSTQTIGGIREYSVTGNKYIQNDSIANLRCTGGGASIYGIHTSVGNVWIQENIIHGFSNTGGGTAGTHRGVWVAGGTTNFVERNHIYDISTSSTNPIVEGIAVTTGTTNHVYNNMISDLRTPMASAANPINGINIGGGTTSNVMFNTVYLDAGSQGANFGSSGIFAATLPTLDMRNNNIVNVSIPSGTGVTAAYRRGGTALASYSNNSNNNNFYADVPGTSNLIYFDGTNSDQTLGSFQARVTPRDASSVTENPPFIDVAVKPYDLRISETVPTKLESGGIAVSSPVAITTDIDGDLRGAIPDIGADEFDGISATPINPSGVLAKTMNTEQIDVEFVLNDNNDDVVIVWNLTGTFIDPIGPPPAVDDPFAGGTLLYNGDTSPVSHGLLTPNTTYYYKVFSYDGAAYSLGVNTSATTTIAPPAPFTATAVNPTQINLAYTKNIGDNDVIIATNTTNTFGSPC